MRAEPALLQGGGVALMFGGFAFSELIAVHQKRSSARRSRFRSGGSGPVSSACPNGTLANGRCKPPAVAALCASQRKRRMMFCSEALRTRYIIRSEEPLPVRFSIVPQLHSKLITRHGQALMFCVLAVHQKRSPMQEAQANHWQEATLQTISQRKRSPSCERMRHCE